MVVEISVQELKAALDAGQVVHLLDVRQPAEHAIAALPGSQLIPLHELPARFQEVSPPPGVAVVVYCHHGMRSQRAAAFLSSQGLADVVSLAGGIDAWSLTIDPSVPRY
jgi:rhodanese-related sulfurtransferase